MKKIIIVLLCLTLVCSSVGFSTAVMNNTIYVDDDGTADYTSIQDAVDAAVDGDTIVVYSGTYQPISIFDKDISIVGKPSEKNDQNTVSEKPIIDALNNTYSAVSIEQSEVLFSNFIVKNGEHKGIHIKNSTHNIISNNTVFDTCEGIDLFESSENLISRNKVYDNWIGIWFYHSSYNNIYNNIIFKNENNGIGLSRSSSNDIKRNMITNNNDDGIFFYASSFNKIKENNLIDNTHQARFENSWSNNWNSNYWNQWRVPIPKPIFGSFSWTIPLLNFDFNPALKSFDIGGE